MGDRPTAQELIDKALAEAREAGIDIGSQLLGVSYAIVAVAQAILETKEK